MNSLPDREGDMRLLRLDAAMELSEDSPAIFKAEADGEDKPPVSQLHEWQPVLEYKERHSSVSESASTAEWELLSPSRASVCGSSARSLIVSEVEERLAADGSLAEALAGAIDTHAGRVPPAAADGELLMKPAINKLVEDSSNLAPHPTAKDDVDEGPTMAVHNADVPVALVQQDELSAAEDPEFLRHECDTCCGRSDSSYEHVSAEEFVLAPDADTTAADAAAAAAANNSSEQATHEAGPGAVSEIITTQLDATATADVVDKADKGASAPAAEPLVVGTLGTLASGEALTKLWSWLHEWAAGMGVGLNMALPRAGVSIYVDQVRSQLGGMDWTRMSLSAGIVVLGCAVVGCVVHNRRLTRSLRSKDREVAKLVMKILSLQDTLQGTRRLPMVRHTAWSVMPTEFF